MTTSPSSSPQLKRVLPWLGGLIVVVLALSFLLLRDSPTEVAPVSSASTRPEAGSSTAKSKPAKPKASAKPRPRASRDRTRRAEFRRRIFRAFGNPIELDASANRQLPEDGGRAPLPEPALGQIPEKLRGTLDKDYIQELIREDFLPLAKECYEAALERDPELGGKLIVEFTVVGDEDVGGIVEEAKVAEGSTIGEEEFVYCMRESMLSLSFDAPEGGGSVQVKYPFLLSNGDGGGSSGGAGDSASDD